MGGDGQGGRERQTGHALFLAQLNVLASSWILWVIVPDIALPFEVAEHQVLIEPTTWILTPLVLVQLARLRAEAPAPARHGFTPVLALATVTGVVDLVRSVVAGGYRPGSVLPSAVDALVAVDLGLFSLAMAQWSGSVATPVEGLVRAWQRSARWAWAGGVVLAGTSLGRAAQLLASGRSLSAGWTTEVEGSGWPAGLVAAAVLVAWLGPLLSVAASTDRTRRALEPALATGPPQGLPTGG